MIHDRSNTARLTSPSKADQAYTALLLSWVLLAYSMVSGTAIIIGGAERWRGPAYETALTFPGAPTSWGVALVVPAVIAMAGLLIPSHPEHENWSRRRKSIYARLVHAKYPLITTGFKLVALWNLFFASTFFQQFREGDAALSPVLTYLTFGVFAVLCDNNYGKKTRRATT